MLPEYKPISDTVAAEIRSAVGADGVLFDAETLRICAKDTSELVHVPEMVVQPDTPEKVVRLLLLANRYHFPVTPRGAGTGLVGGALAAHGGVVCSLAAMNRIRKVDTRNLVAEVEPGVITHDLRQVRHNPRLHPWTGGGATQREPHSYRCENPQRRRRLRHDPSDRRLGRHPGGDYRSDPQAYSASGEHGIGMAIMPFIDMELSLESIRLQMEIKRLFDPNLILNPGKIFDWSGGPKTKRTHR